MSGNGKIAYLNYKTIFSRDKNLVSGQEIIAKGTSEEQSNFITTKICFSFVVSTVYDYLYECAVLLGFFEIFW